MTDPAMIPIEDAETRWRFDPWSFAAGMLAALMIATVLVWVAVGLVEWL